MKPMVNATTSTLPRRNYKYAALEKQRISTGLSDLTVGVVTPRLHQNGAPKLALQIMLGVMTLCGLFAFWFTGMRNVLPYNP